MPESCADRTCSGLAEDDCTLCTDCIRHLHAVKAGAARAVHSTRGLVRELNSSGLEMNGRRADWRDIVDPETNVATGRRRIRYAAQ